MTIVEKKLSELKPYEKMRKLKILTLTLIWETLDSMY